MNKRLLALLIALCMAVGLVPAISAAETVAEGICGENLTWVLTDDGTLTISGEGDMTDFGGYGSPWFSVRDSIYTVVIESGVTSIGENAFGWCTMVNEISIPEGVTRIGRAGLSGCRSLTVVTLPSTLEALGHQVFNECSGLDELYFTGNAPTFGTYVFNYVSGLTVYYPENDSTWTSAVMKDHGGYSIRWQPYACAQGHELGYWATVTAPTCTENGTETRSCLNCDYTETQETPALGHNYEDGTCTRCGEANNPFTDVPSDSFYYTPVLWALENNITTGASDTTFNPNGQCQRAQVVTFLWRAAGCPEPTTSVNPFTDVKESDFFYKAVLWAVEHGITNGTSATTFSPYTACNRAAVVTFLYRAMGEPAYTTTASPFTDVTNSVAFYYDAVLWAVENDITNGMGDSTFGINEICNRAQVVTFLYRAYD